MRIISFIVFIFGVSDFASSSDILAVIPSPFYSHQNTFRPLWRELAKKGHKITLITTDLMEQNENITQLDYKETYDIFKRHNIEELFKGGYNFFTLISKLSEMTDDLLDFQFTHPALLEMLESNKKFDLMLVEFSLPLWPLLSVKFNCPFIGLSTMDSHPGAHAMVGNAVHPVIYPYADFAYGDKLTLRERVFSTGFAVIGMLLGRFFFNPVLNGYARKYLGDGLPDANDIHGNTSILFVNANPVFFPPRPVTPITINLAGRIHIDEPKDLPQDLQKYLDDSKDGCIYVSFGTTVNSEYLSEEQKNTFVNVFKSMAPMKILWKFDDLNVARGAKNIEVRKWLPQQDVLRHPNVKLFITQGGLQSMEEAIDSAVPMLGMPFYGDQLNNVNKMHDKKFGLRLNPTDMTEKTLKSSIDELLQNPSYKQMTNKISAIAKDQPMNGLEKAVWWTEYVIRHGGTQHLRSPSADIPLYQYFFLDVISVTVAIMYVAYIIMKRVLRLACRSIRSLKDLYYARKEKEE